MGFPYFPNHSQITLLDQKYSITQGQTLLEKCLAYACPNVEFILGSALIGWSKITKSTASISANQNSGNSKTPSSAAFVY